MSDRELQSIAPADISSGEALAKTLLALNNAHAQELSWLEPERLEHLVKEAFLARRIGNLDAFLLASGCSIRQPEFLVVLRPLSALCVCGPDRGRIIRARLRAQALPRSVRTCR